MKFGENLGDSTTAPTRPITWAARRHRLAEERISPRGGPGQPEQHPDRRGLAGAVGPEEAVHAARRAPPGRGRRRRPGVRPGDRGTPCAGRVVSMTRSLMPVTHVRSPSPARPRGPVRKEDGSRPRACRAARRQAPRADQLDARRAAGLGARLVVRGRRRTAPTRAAGRGAARTLGRTSVTVTSRPSSRLSEVTPASAMPQGTNRSYHPRSTSQLSANPCMVTPRLTRMPSAAILRSGPPVVGAQPDAAAPGHPGGGDAEVRADADQRLLDAADVVDDLDVVGQRDDRVADQLAGAVEGDLAAAVDVDDRRRRRGRAAARAGRCACRR